VVRAAADKVIAESKTKVKYLVGTMIEIPRAAYHGGQGRRDRGVLLVRNQRPDSDHLRSWFPDDVAKAGS